MMTVFTEDEMLILAMYMAGSRVEAIESLEEALTESDYPDAAELISGALEKLALITDEDYLQQDLDEYSGMLEDIRSEDA